MVAYSFKSRFVAPIEARTKRQTIRAVGKKRHARRGDYLQIYTGDRFHPRLVGRAKCEAAVPVLLAFGNATLRPFVQIGEQGPNASLIIKPADLDAFATRDGFGDWQGLADFWAETHGDVAEWTGLLITWGDTFVPGPPPAGV